MTLIKTIAVPPGELPKHLVMSPQEEAAHLAEQAANEAARPRQELLEKIQKLESSITSRMLRDAALGIENTRLQNIENQIAALRSQL